MFMPAFHIVLDNKCDRFSHHIKYDMIFSVYSDYCVFQKQLIKDKDDIREALDRKEINDGETDLSALFE